MSILVREYAYSNILPMFPIPFSKPLLHHSPASLEFRHLPENLPHILQFRTRKRRHQCKFPALALPRTDEVIDVANSVGRVETRDEAGAVPEADLDG